MYRYVDRMTSRVSTGIAALAVVVMSLTSATGAVALEPLPNESAPVKAAPTATDASAIGELVELSDLPGSTGSTFFVRGESGDTTAVGADAVQEIGAVAGDKVEIADGELSVVSPIEEAAPGLAHTVDVVLVTVRMPAADGRPAYDARPSASVDTVTSWISYASDHLRQASNSRVASLALGARAEITTAGTCQLDLAGSSGDLTVWNEAARAISPGRNAASYENSGGRHLLVVFPAECADAWQGSVGIANVGGGLSYGGNIALLDLGRGQRQAFLHEFGHNLSLRHANNYACLPLQKHWEGNEGCGFAEYADVYDPMGIVVDGDYDSPLFNAAHRDALGGYPEGSLVTVEQDASTSVTLRPASSANGTLAIKVRDSNGWDYYLDLRNGRGSFESGAYYARGRECEITWVCTRDYGVRITQQQSAGTTSYAVASAQDDGDGYALVKGDWFSSSEGTTCDIWLSVDDMSMDGAGRPTSATVTVRTGDKAPACGTSPDGVHPWFQAKYKELGGASGPLGKPIAPMVCQSSACWQEFAGGVLTSDGTQIVMLSTAYVTTWLANGGPDGALGLVAGPESCFGTSCATPFTGGVITWVPGQGVTAVPVHPWFQAKWKELGGITGSIGTPTEGMRCQSSACWQQFTGGVLTSDGRQIVRLSSAYVSTWTAWGGPDGDLGLVAGGESCFGTYCQASFVGGVIVWVPNSGVYPVAKKWFYPAWMARGGATGSLGLPSDAMKCQSAACYQVFRKGTLTSSTSGILSLSSAYVSRWIGWGGPDGQLGLLTGPEVCSGSFCQVPFQRGLMVWQPGTDVRTLFGDEADEWRRTHPVMAPAR
ncbi:hypothetical protein NS220_11940 [Microbacterium testaceum]|uniref:Uncharacterized protein n=2 Tax=Microbacterium testaceum TaxID=2033 RepID=A0A147EVH5_MICTE|nr:hypothetical protein NS220_11940 [Microbacterium testaceum]